MTNDQQNLFPIETVTCERARTHLVIVPKNGCTSLLWAIADLEGYSPSGADVSRRADFKSPEMIIHDYTRYRPSSLATRPAAEALSLWNDPSYRRVMLVRDPVQRLYAAWESKILIRSEPRDIFLNAAPPVRDAGGINITASFRRFVATLPGSPILEDGHFATQTSIFNALPAGEIELIDVAEIPAVVASLEERSGTRLTVRRANEGLGIRAAELLDEPTIAIIDDLYGSDFELTRTPRPAPASGDPVRLDCSESALLDRITQTSRRIEQIDCSWRHASQRFRRAGDFIRRR